MAENGPSPAASNAGVKSSVARPRPLSRIQQLNKLYALPAPLRTFPLPTLVPHNPLSLFHILYVWLSQVVKPEPSHHEIPFQGLFSADTRSVHVTDARSIRGLWEQGFYGKGSLSRSEPTWLDREKTRRGTEAKKTSEDATRQRRAERQQTKWERARKEREAIDRRRLEELEAAEAAVEKDDPFDERQFGTSDVEGVVVASAIIETSKTDLSNLSEVSAPVGPLQLLLLPNSALELDSHMRTQSSITSTAKDVNGTYISPVFIPPTGPMELLALPNSATTTSPLVSRNQTGEIVDTRGFNDHGKATSQSKHVPLISGEIPPPSNEHSKTDDSDVVGGSETNDDAIDGSTHSDDTVETNATAPNGSALLNGSGAPARLRREKSVRFSPTVEKTTFIQTEPPKPEHSVVTTELAHTPLPIKDQEHTQLTLEEAFFLSYGLGALNVLDPETRRPIANKELFTLFRKSSYFQPAANQLLSPDDPFMINYVVYHHYRSLGWVPRSGVKFSVDLMLYVRGPVFTHAEFAVLILPSYSDPYWSSDIFLQNYVKSREQRTWAWVSCINRVITQVKKTLILTYVDIPPPLEKDQERDLGIDRILSRYKIREIVMKRWAANRSR